jgi:ketosteroid isomerase-like protein
MAKNIDAAAERRVADFSTRDDLEQLYGKLIKGDVDAARALLTHDAVLRVPGRSQISGVYHGPESIAGYFSSLRDLSERTAEIVVMDMTQVAGRAVALQRLVARRGGRKLEDEQNVVLRLHMERVTEILLFPNDIRAHDVFWGRAPLLTPEDRDLLAAAIKAGSAPPPDPNARRRVIAWFVVAVAVFLLSIVVFNWLNSHYSRQQLLATTTDLASVDHLVIANDGGRASWRLEPTTAKRASITDPLGEVRFALPIPRAECDALATSLGATCTGGTVSVEAPFDLSWSEPARITGGVKTASRLDIDLKGGTEDRPFSEMSLATISEKSPTLCFTEPVERIEMLLGETGERMVRAQVRPHLPPLDCESGVVLSIGDGRSEEQGTSIVFGDVSAVEMDARGTYVDIDGLAGRLALVNLERHVFDDAAHVISTAASAEPILTEIDVGEVDSRLTMRSGEVSSVLTDDGELLPTQWERLPQPLVALIGSLATALVLPALIAFLQMGRDRLLLGRTHPR